MTKLIRNSSTFLNPEYYPEKQSFKAKNENIYLGVQKNPLLVKKDGKKGISLTKKINLSNSKYKLSNQQYLQQTSSNVPEICNVSHSIKNLPLKPNFYEHSLSQSSVSSRSLKQSISIPSKLNIFTVDRRPHLVHIQQTRKPVIIKNGQKQSLVYEEYFNYPQQKKFISQPIHIKKQPMKSRSLENSYHVRCQRLFMTRRMYPVQKNVVFDVQNNTLVHSFHQVKYANCTDTPISYTSNLNKFTQMRIDGIKSISTSKQNKEIQKSHAGFPNFISKKQSMDTQNTLSDQTESFRLLNESISPKLSRQTCISSSEGHLNSSNAFKSQSYFSNQKLIFSAKQLWDSKQNLVVSIINQDPQKSIIQNRSDLNINSFIIQKTSAESNE